MTAKEGRRVLMSSDGFNAIYDDRVTSGAARGQLAEPYLQARCTDCRPESRRGSAAGRGRAGNAFMPTSPSSHHTRRSTHIVVSSMRFMVALAAVAVLAGCAGGGASGAPPAALGTVTSPTPSAAGSPTASPAGSQAETCKPFGHPIDPLPAVQRGETQLAEESGCGPGRVPSSGTFTVDASANWILRFAYTCDGIFDVMGDPAVVFTAHNTVSGVDLTPVIQPGPWGYGAGGLTGDISGAPPPIGTYVVLVKVANPGLHTCQWRAAVGRGLT